MDRVLRVLVVDDSAYVRKVIKQILSRSPFLEVVGTARDGEEALLLVEDLRPDVVTVDLIMPGMGGVGFIREQMSRRPVPIVVVSIANEASQVVLDALDAGAIDFVQKPSALASEKIFELSDDLIQKVKVAGAVEMGHVTNIPEPPAASPPVVPSRSRAQQVGCDIVVVAISTGGPQALRYMIPLLPADLAVPVIVVIHMPVGYTEMYASKLNEISPVHVREAHDGDVLEGGNVFIAPAGRHLTLRRAPDGRVQAHLDSRPFDSLHKPSANVLFTSAAEVFGSRVLGVVMTGMGDDGLEGARSIRARGGKIYAEAEDTSVVYGMPRAVVEAQLADRVIPLDRMARAILETIYGQDLDYR